MTFKDFVVGIFMDTTSTPSSKRLVGIFFSVLVGIAFLANLFWGFTMDHFIFEAGVIIVGSALGFTTIEHFSPRKGEDDAG